MKKNNNLFQPELMNEALKQSFIKLNPAKMILNPVMFMVWVGTLVMAGVCIWIALGEKNQGSLGYNIEVIFILFLTLLFANFVEAIAKQDSSMLNASIQVGAHIAAFSQMGNIAYRTGKKLYWDKEKRKFTDKKANQYLQAKYHNGYKLSNT